MRFSKVALALVVLSASGFCQQTSTVTQYITQSGGSVTIPNNLQGTGVQFSYSISGLPVSSTIVAQGGYSSGNYDILNTYTGNASGPTIIAPSVPQVYDHFNVVASWLGGSSLVIITVKTTITGGTGPPTTNPTSNGLLSNLTPGQSVSALNASQLVSSGPSFDTTKIASTLTTDFGTRVNICNGILAVYGGGVCNALAEAASTVTTAATISANNVTLILPSLQITLGTGEQFNLTGNNDAILCLQKWGCLLNGSNNGAAGIVNVTGNNDRLDGFEAIGGLLYNQNGIEIQLAGNDDVVENVYMLQAGQMGISTAGANRATIRQNKVQQAAKACIYVNTATGTGYDNKILDNNLLDCNTTDSGDGQLGIASSGGLGLTRGTLIEGNTLRGLGAGTGNGILSRTMCNFDVTGAIGQPLASISTPSGGNVSITFSSNPNLTANSSYLVFTGATFAGANGNFNQASGLLVTSTSGTTPWTTVVATTATGANTALGTFVVGGHGSNATTCSEGIQVTDNPIDTLITANFVINTWREGIVIAGTGNSIQNNHCESCGQISTGVGAYMWSNTTTPQAILGDGNITGNIATNRTANLAIGYCVSINDATASLGFTLENFLVGGNQCFADTTLSGPPSFSKGFRYINNSANTVILQNVTFSNNEACRGVTTPISVTATNTTGTVVQENNRVNCSADTIAVAGDVTQFDAALNPNADSGAKATSIGWAPQAGYCQGPIGGAALTVYTLFPFIGTTLADTCGQATSLEWISPIACTTKNLYVVASAAGQAANSGVVTVYIANATSTLTCTLGTGTSCHDITDHPTIAAGQTYSIRVETDTAGTDTTANIRASFVCQ